MVKLHDDDDGVNFERSTHTMGTTGNQFEASVRRMKRKFAWKQTREVLIKMQWKNASNQAKANTNGDNLAIGRKSWKRTRDITHRQTHTQKSVVWQESNSPVNVYYYCQVSPLRTERNQFPPIWKNCLIIWIIINQPMLHVRRQINEGVAYLKVLE